MAQIQVQNLTFAYDGAYDMIFDDVSFRIDTDWKLGLVGRNGRGKTTFLRLLQGGLEYRGTISSPVEFTYFPFPVEDEGALTLDIIEKTDPGYELWKICRELNLMEADCGILYRPFDTLSNGERTKALLALLFSRESQFLLIDEPTNHLDWESRQTLMRYLNRKKGFLLVSHDRMFLDGCVDHIMAINRQDITVTKGNFSVWWENKERQDAMEAARNEQLKKEIGQLRMAARRAEGWSYQAEKMKRGSARPDHGDVDRGYVGHKAAKVMKRAKGIEDRARDAVREKEWLLKNVETAENLKLFPLTHRKEILASLEDVTISYGERTVLSGFSLKVKNGERLVLSGPNGCGKSSVLKVLCGDLDPAAGRVELASGLIISRVPQDTSFLSGRLEDYGVRNGLEESLFKALLRKLDFSREQLGKQMQDFSEGQKKKVLIAASLCQQAHLYIWDEPLNYIDVFSRMQIEELILRWKPAMLLVEHDEYFIRKIGARIVTL